MTLPTPTQLADAIRQALADYPDEHLPASISFPSVSKRHTLYKAIGKVDYAPRLAT
jgi:hypothetical protein